MAALATRSDVAHCVLAEAEVGEAGDELGCVLGRDDAGPPGVVVDDAPAPPPEPGPDPQAATIAIIATPPQVTATAAAARRPAREIPAMTMPP